MTTLVSTGIPHDKMAEAWVRGLTLRISPKLLFIEEKGDVSEYGSWNFPVRTPVCLTIFPDIRFTRSVTTQLTFHTLAQQQLLSEGKGWLKLHTCICSPHSCKYRAFHNVLRDYKHLLQESQRTYLNEIVHSQRKTEFFFVTNRDVRYVHHGWHGTHR